MKLKLRNTHPKNQQFIFAAPFANAWKKISGEIFDRIQLVLFFLHFAVRLKRKIKICSFRPQQIYLEYLGAIKMGDTDEISI